MQGNSTLRTRFVNKFSICQIKSYSGIVTLQGDKITVKYLKIVILDNWGAPKTMIETFTVR